MCVICLEFNRRKDIFDALDMVVAAGMEPNSIDKRHLTEVRKELEKMIYEDKVYSIDLNWRLGCL